MATPPWWCGSGSSGGGEGAKGETETARTWLWRVAFALVVLTVFLYAVPVWPLGDRTLMILAIAWMMIGCVVASAVLYRLVRPRSPLAQAAFVATAVLLSTAVVAWAMSSLSMWCCMREQDLASMCNLAQVVVSHLTAAGIPYWMCHGSLLGTAREKTSPFQAIPWEHDLDLCILDKDYPTFVATFVGQREYVLTDKHRVVYANNLRARVLRTYVDLFLVKENDVAGTIVPDDAEPIPRAAIFPTRPLRVCNQMWQGPNDIEANLQPYFGTGWKTRLMPSTCLTWQDGCS
eukprot:m.484783 g.484783  ORF g.484783 m.484783 type:complete len:290 (-) comp23542_c0_seq1:20-889(-)